MFIQERVLDEFDAVPLKPGGVRCGKTLFGGIGHLIGDAALHYITEDLFAVVGFFIIFFQFTGFVFVNADDFGKIIDLEGYGAAHGKIYQIVVKKRHASFEAVSHAEFVIHDQEAVQEGLRLEVKGVVDVILRLFQFVIVLLEDIAKDVPGPDVFDIVPNRGEYLLDDSVGQKSLPE